MARSDISWSSLLLVFTGTATTEIYTLSLHDALPILSPKEEAWHTLETACTGEKVTDRANATRVLGLELGSRWHGRSPSLLCMQFRACAKPPLSDSRSEERRVGKECRSRLLPSQ